MAYVTGAPSLRCKRPHSGKIFAMTQAVPHQFHFGEPMTDNIRALFDRWERVWHEGRFDLIPDCVGSHYIRHDERGDRTVTRDEYAAELHTVHRDRPGIRVVVYDHSFSTNRAWFRFAFVWPDPTTGEQRSRAGMQSYRIEGGKLAETWITMLGLGTTWADEPQESWTRRKE